MQMFYKGKKISVKNAFKLDENDFYDNVDVYNKVV